VADIQMIDQVRCFLRILPIIVFVKLLLSKGSRC
jgi:hypothetical protein